MSEDKRLSGVLEKRGHACVPRRRWLHHSLPHPRSGRPPMGAATSQPTRARPLGVHQADLPLFPWHFRPAFHTREGQQPTEGLSKRGGSMAVDRRTTSGCASPITESGHIAATHGGKEASRPCSPASDTFGDLKGPTTFTFKHHSSHHDHARAARPPLPPTLTPNTSRAITGPARSPKLDDPPFNFHMRNTSGRHARSPLFPPRVSTSLHPLGCARSEGELSRKWRSVKTPLHYTSIVQYVQAAPLIINSPLSGFCIVFTLLYTHGMCARHMNHFSLHTHTHTRVRARPLTTVVAAQPALPYKYGCKAVLYNDGM